MEEEADFRFIRVIVVPTASRSRIILAQAGSTSRTR